MFGYNDILKRFIVIEGIDGAGTSTQRTLLSTAMEKSGNKVMDTWEPTDGPVGSLIREVLRGQAHLSDATMARLFAADRNEHLENPNGIRAFLKNDGWVICDRYILSSLAYQGMLVGDDFVWKLNESFPLPEYLAFIDVDLKTSSRRRKERGVPEEIYETDTIQAQVRARYQEKIALLEGARPDVHIKRFDGSKAISELHRELCGFLGITPIQ